MARAGRPGRDLGLRRTNRSAPAPPVIRSIPGPPTSTSEPKPPNSSSSPARPHSRSLPARPRIRSAPAVPRRTSSPGVPTISLAGGAWLELERADVRVGAGRLRPRHAALVGGRRSRPGRRRPRRGCPTRRAGRWSGSARHCRRAGRRRSSGRSRRTAGSPTRSPDRLEHCWRRSLPKMLWPLLPVISPATSAFVLAVAALPTMMNQCYGTVSVVVAAEYPATATCRRVPADRTVRQGHLIASDAATPGVDIHRFISTDRAVGQGHSSSHESRRLRSPRYCCQPCCRSVSHHSRRSRRPGRYCPPCCCR